MSDLRPCPLCGIERKLIDSWIEVELRGGGEEIISACEPCLHSLVNPDMIKAFTPGWNDEEGGLAFDFIVNWWNGDIPDDSPKSLIEVIHILLGKAEYWSELLYHDMKLIQRPRREKEGKNG